MPKGKMIEGRSGGSGRGTRRESWAPPDSGSSTSGSYVVSCTTLDPRRPLISFPPPLPHPSHLPAGHGEKFCRTQAHVQLCTRLAEWPAQRENDRFCSGTAAAVVLRTDPDASRPPRPPRISLRPPPLRHRLHLHPGRRLKSSDRTHRTSALHPSPQSGAHKGR